MTRGSASRREARTYESPLREEQAERTRERILDGLLAAMKDGLADLSIPAVARAAQVSVPTVYRHFPTKKALFAAAGAHVGARTGLLDVPVPSDEASLFTFVRETFRRLDAMDPSMAAALAGALGKQVRREGMIPHRRRAFEAALAPALAALPADEREHLVRITVVLASSAALRTFKDYLGVSADDAAESVNWALRTLAASATRGKHGWRKQPEQSRKTKS